MLQNWEIYCWAVYPVTNMSNCYSSAVTHKHTLACLHQCFVVSLTNEASLGHSSDLYHEHLLDQLGQSSDKQQVCYSQRKFAPLSFEVEGETSWELRRAGSVTVVPPLSALLGLCTLSPCGPTHQLVDAAGCVFRLSLCCVIEWDRLVR